jgi:hypothetical protein
LTKEVSAIFLWDLHVLKKFYDLGMEWVVIEPNSIDSRWTEPLSEIRAAKQQATENWLRTSLSGKDWAERFELDLATFHLAG